jgi:hypothetical protein
MKPTITIDERGILLHMTDSEGHGVVVPLTRETLDELAAQVAVVVAKIKGPDGGNFLWNVARAVAREVLDTKKEGRTHGTESDHDER